MNQRATDQLAYTRPVAFLPATSLLPPAPHAAASDCQLDGDLLHTVVVAAAQISVRWQQVVVGGLRTI